MSGYTDYTPGMRFPSGTIERGGTMKLLTVKKRHFRGKECCIGAGFVSNGHWAVRTSRLANADLFAANNDDGEACRAAFPGVHVRPRAIGFEAAAGAHPVVAWTTTHYLCSVPQLAGVYSTPSRTTLARILTNEAGTLALLDSAYLAMVDMDKAGVTLYGAPTGCAPFRDADDLADATLLLMPISAKDLPVFPTYHKEETDQ